MIFDKIIANDKCCRRDVSWRSSAIAMLLLLISSFSLTAQNKTDWGMVKVVECQKQLADKWMIGVKEDLRVDHNFSHYSRSKTTLSADYKFVRYGIKLGAGFDFINKYTGKHIYRNRYRFFLNASYKYVYRNWEFGYRMRFLTMFHDERTGYYNYEPEYNWRNKLSVSYQRRFSRFKYSLSGETYSAFNKDKQLELSDLVFEGSVEYRMTKRQYLSFYVKDYRDIYIESDQIRTVYFGLGWRFKH